MTQRPKILSSHFLYRGFIDIKQDLLERKDGQQATYTCLHTPHAAAVLAQTKEGLWILNREYRHPTGDRLLGCPGGRLEEGEDPILGGQRELFEETGYWSDDIQVIGCCHPFPATCNQKIYYLLAKNAYKKAEPALDPFEYIETELKTDEELRQQIRLSENIDGVLCTALWYKDHFC